MKNFSTLTDEMFENIRDAALMGDKNKLNELFNNYSLQEDSFYVLKFFNSKLLKLLEILNLKGPEECGDGINKLNHQYFGKINQFLQIY